MNKKILIITGIILMIICAVHIRIHGHTYVMTNEMGQYGNSASDFEITDDKNGKVVRITDVYEDGGYLKIKVESVSPGSTYISAMNKDGVGFAERMIVHRSGVITSGSYFGNSTGSRIIPFASALYILLIMLMLIRKYRKNVKEDMYRYRNVLELGLIIFLFFILWTQLHIFTLYRGPAESIQNLMYAASAFAIIMFPIAILLSIAISLSNIRLMMKEGVTWRNMLGFILGLLLMAGTLIPYYIEGFLQQTSLIDVHKEQGIGHFIEMIVDSLSYSVIAYLECILAGTIIFGIIAARHIPAFNKDYILILGCQIRKDGTLTPLLKSRADRALEFAKMQKEATGKDIKFVPSGGQGPDEVIAEADAIKAYLTSQGVPEEKIISENKSLNTYENIRNSMALISQDPAADDSKVAFSTTNYHVFRSGMIASRQGHKIEGIGSKTKSYFWINAFIREYIATLVEEKNTHIKIFIALVVLDIIVASINYLSVIM